MRTTIIGANWKMHKDPAGTTAFFGRFCPLVKSDVHSEIVICPSFLDIEKAVKASHGTRIRIGAQNLYWEAEGAFTGEVSAEMVLASGCSHVIVGHSERREHFGETDESVWKKTVAALNGGLTPIVCVGEREQKDVEALLARQFHGGICPLTEGQFARIVIAYEPLWAIGDGQTATPEVAANAHRLIRAQARARFGQEAADSVRIIYGGSVKPDNAMGLKAQTEIDGFLVGGASLDPVSFAELVNL
jgi:triosephosphate isomerase